MKKTARLFILLIGMAGSKAMAQDAFMPTPTSTAIPASLTGAAPAAQVTPQKTPGIPLVYFSLGVGTALIGNGFGTEGNPWVDAFSATLANGYGTSFSPSLAFLALIGLNLDKNWSVNLSLETYSFSGAQSSASNEENIIPSVRYTFGSGWFSPYITAGYGFNFNTTSVTAPTTIINNEPTGQLGFTSEAVANMVASGGIGLLFKVAGDQTGHAYIGAQYQQVFTEQGGFSYYPLIIGYQYP